MNTLSAKRFGSSLLLLTLCTEVAPAQDSEPPTPIRSIQFSGREHISRDKLLGVISLRPGDVWTTVTREQAMARLTRWPYVSLVDPPIVSREGGLADVVFNIRENPVIGGIRFVDNVRYSNRELLTVSQLRHGVPIAAEQLRSAKERIVAHYHRDGFLLVAVGSHARKIGGGRAEIVFRIAEERRVYLSEILLEGVRQLPTAEVLTSMRIQPRRFFGVISRGYYVPELLQEDLSRIRAFYESQGFLSARSGLAGLDFTDDYGRVTLRIQVQEGPRTTLAAVRIEGHTLFPTELLERELAVPVGGFYLQETIAAGAARLQQWYQEHSDRVPTITVDPEYGPKHEATAVFRINESEHYVTGKVRVVGNKKTRERVVRQDLTVVPGEPLTLLEIGRSMRRLRKRGNFRRVEWTVEDSTLPDTPGTAYRDVEFRVTEHEQRGIFQLGGGAASGEGEVGYFALSQPNFDLFRLPGAWNDWDNAFVGGGQRLNVELIPGTKEAEYRVAFEEPYFFRQDLSLGVRGSTSRLERRGYDENHQRGTIRLRKYWDRDLRLSASLSYTVDQVQITDFGNSTPQDALDAQGYTFLAYPGLELRYEKLDVNYFSGPSGYRLLGKGDFADSATGSDVDFFRLVGRADAFISLRERHPDHRHLLHAGVEVGRVKGLEGDATPIFERFFLGGARSFRGFEYRRLGPTQGTTPVGGEGMLRGTVQYSLPLFWREIRAVALFDWGDLAPTFSRISTGRFRTAAGAGLQLRLRLVGQPMPVNLYWVEALSSEQGDREQVFAFTLGYFF